jgi:hypothetical protein
MSAELHIRTPLQRLLVERALALAQELEAGADAAPDGQVLDRSAALLVGAGRDFLRHALEAAVQAQISAAEKKGGRRAPVPAAAPAGTRAVPPGLR